MKTPSSHPLRLYLIPGLILLAAFGLRVYHLDAQSLWYDEGYSLYLARLSLPEATLWTTRDVVPPLYYYALHLWIGAAGNSEFAARLLSACLGVLALPLGYRIAARWFDRRAGLLALLLLAWSPLYVWHSQDARMYMPMTTVNLIALWALTMIIQTCQAVRNLAGQCRWWWVWGVALAALVYLHTTGVFIAAAQALTLLLFAWRNKRLRQALPRVCGVGLAVWLAYAPWLWLAWREYTVNAGYFPGTLPPLAVISTALRAYATGDVFAEPAGPMLAGALLILLVLAALALARRRVPLLPEAGPKERHAALFLLLTLLLPLLLMAAAFYRVPKFASRYTLAASPTFFILLAGGLAAWAQQTRWPKAAAAVVSAAALVVYAAGVELIYADARLSKDDFRGAARYLQNHIAADETVLLLSGHFKTVWDYYYPGERTPLPDIPILNLNETLNYATADTLNLALAGKRGAWVVRWQDEVIDPNGFVQMFLDQAGQPQPVPITLNGVKLWHYRWDAPPHFSNQPAVAQPLGVHFGPIQLAGYTQLTDTITLYWQAGTRPDRDYRMALRLRDLAGDLLGKYDARPTTFLYPTSYWKPGEVLFGQHALPLPPGTPPGRYQVSLSLYDESSGRPLGLTDARGQAIGVWQTLPVTLTRTWRAQDIASPPHTRLSLTFNDELQLDGFSLTPASLIVGDLTRLELDWQARRAPLTHYAIRIEWAAGEQAVSVITPTLAAQHLTPSWRAGEAVRARYTLRAPTTPGTFDLRFQLLDARYLPVGQPVRLATHTIRAGEHDFAPPSPQRLSGVSLGDMTLLGADLSADQIRPGQSLRLTLYWRAERPVESSLTVFTHMLGQDERPLAQHDGLPAGGARPTNTWLASETIRDLHEWTLPPDTPPGTYRIKVGLYDAGQPGLPRLPVLDPAGQTVADGVLLGTFQVTR